MPTTSAVDITGHALHLLNGERNKVQAPMVGRYPGMDAYASEWAEEMAAADTLAQSPSSPYSGEVIVSGATSAKQALVTWMDSPASRDIILNPAYTRVGIGYADGYWCVVLS